MMENNSKENNGQAIIEDEQQLYDWGIENRLEQYYANNPGATFIHASEPSYVPNHHPAHHDEPAAHLPHEQQHPQGFQDHHLGPPAAHQPPHCRNLSYISYTPDAIKQEPEPPGDPVSLTSPNGPTVMTYASKRPTTASGRRTNLQQVDMDANELLKVERKRARNRVAASKCRMRKLERIAVLDQQAKQLRAENEELGNLVEKLKAQVYSLKQELRWHVNNGCNVFAASGKSQSDSPDSTTPSVLQAVIDRPIQTSMASMITS